MRHDAGAILLPMLTEGKPKRAYLFPALEGQYHRWYHLLAQVAAYFGLQQFKWTVRTQNNASTECLTLFSNSGKGGLSNRGPLKLL